MANSVGNYPAYDHPLDNIEDIDDFYSAINRHHLTKSLAKDRPYTYWTIELYDQENGIRGGGGLGVLAADTRRVAEQNNVPFVLITPFYPSEQHQDYQKTAHGFKNQITHLPVDYTKFSFNYVDTVHIKANGGLVKLSVIEKTLGSTKIICVTEPGFGELYSGDSCGDHRLFQEVSLGFGGYQALKLLGLRPAVMQLNEVATFFAALARLDELVSSGMDFYEAVVYTRKHTLYTNHTLVQAAEAEFSYEQFERFVFPNLKSPAVRKWLSNNFENGHIKLSAITIEIAELRSGVSKLHARVADYRDLAGKKIKFKPITNGIDIPKWTADNIVKFLQEKGIIDKFYHPTKDFEEKIDTISASEIRPLKQAGRRNLNLILSKYHNQYGQPIKIPNSAIVFEFKRRFVDYKRPWLPFSRPEIIRKILDSHNAYYILSGRIHEGDDKMAARLENLLQLIDSDEILKSRVHYIPNYNEEIGKALSIGSNISINNPIVGLEACGTSWMKDVINLGILISTHDGGIADCSSDSYLSISGKTEPEEITSLYARMEEAATAWENDFDLEVIIKTELKNYLPIISGTRMLKEYIEYLF